MKVDCQLIPAPVSEEWKDAIIVVIDVLRATSTIVTAFMNGCRSIVPVAEVEEAFQLVRGSMPHALIGGEREGIAVDGFDLGNSPQEYTSSRVQGKTVVLTTTNGSRAFRSLPQGTVGIAASFLNLEAVARYCLRQGRDILFILSGGEGKFSLEDTVCAGGILGIIRKQLQGGLEMTDAALAAEILYDHFRRNLVAMLRSALHGRSLIEIGAESDLEYCAQVDVTVVVPFYHDGEIVLFTEHPEPA